MLLISFLMEDNNNLNNNLNNLPNTDDKKKETQNPPKEDEELSCEEFEEEENGYEDDNLVSNEELELLNKHFEFQIVREGEGQDQPGEEDHDEMEVEEDLQIKREYEGFLADGEIYSIAMNEKGVLVIGDGEDTTYLFDLNKKETIRKEKMNKDSVIEVSFSCDNKFLVTACLDGTVSIFDEEFKLLNQVSGSFSDINVFLF